MTLSRARRRAVLGLFTYGFSRRSVARVLGLRVAIVDQILRRQLRWQKRRP